MADLSTLNDEELEDIDMIPPEISNQQPIASEAESPEKAAPMGFDFCSKAVQSQLAEIESHKPPRSGYMLFAKENRHLIAAESCGVADQAKKIGALWSALSEQEQNEWIEKVETAKEDFERYLAEHPEHRRLLEAEKEYKKNKAKKVAIPLATIKKIVSKDPDIGRVSKESYLLMNQCATLFVEELVKAANEQHTVPRKSKTLTEMDVVNTFHSNNKYMFIRHVFKKNKHSLLGTDRDSSHHQHHGPIVKKAKRNAVPESANSITNFFSKK